MSKSWNFVQATREIALRQVQAVCSFFFVDQSIAIHALISSVQSCFERLLPLITQRSRRRGKTCSPCHRLFEEQLFASNECQSSSSRSISLKKRRQTELDRSSFSSCVMRDGQNAYLSLTFLLNRKKIRRVFQRGNALRFSLSLFSGEGKMKRRSLPS